MCCSHNIEPTHKSKLYLLCVCVCVCVHACVCVCMDVCFLTKASLTPKNASCLIIAFPDTCKKNVHTHTHKHTHVYIEVILFFQNQYTCTKLGRRDGTEEEEGHGVTFGNNVVTCTVKAGSQMLGSLYKFWWVLIT